MLGKAKNIEFAMRLIAMDYYGKDIRIWAPQEMDGLTEEAQDELVQMAGVDGQVVLLEWSEEELRPVAFLYTEGRYTVRFAYDRIQKTGSWEVYRTKRMLEFGN